jgi:membrane-associated phospholipid phosphatase
MIDHTFAKKTPETVHPGIARHFIVAFIGVLISAIGFILLAHAIREGETLPFDRAILLWIHGWAPEGLGSAVVTATNVGGPVGTVIITAILAGLLWYKRRKYAAITVVAGVAGAAAMNIVLKSLFERSRPDLWARLVHEASFSFPSGHAMASSALVFSVMVVLWRTKWRVLAISIGLVYMVIIGFTRLYLGVHYPTDIIAGWLVSLGWVATVATLISRYIDRHHRLNNAA